MCGPGQMCILYSGTGGRVGASLTLPNPPPTKTIPASPHPCFRSLEKLLWTIWSSCGLYLPPPPPSASREVTARLSGPILQPREVEATAAVDQSARTEGGLAEDLLPAGQTQPDTSGFPGPQNCP